MKKIKELTRAMMVMSILPFCVSPVKSAEPSSDDPSLQPIDFDGTSMGYVKAVEEIKLGYDTQVMLIEMTYQEDLSKELTEKIQNDTGFEGEISGDSQALYASNDKISPSETLAKMMSYDELMDIAVKAKDKSDVGTIASVSNILDKGAYREAYLKYVTNKFLNSGEVKYAKTGEFVNITGNVDTKRSLFNLKGVSSEFTEYESYVNKTLKGDGYKIPFDKNYTDISVFSSMAPEYALFKYNVVSANTIDEMEAMLQEHMFKTGKNAEDSKINAKLNMFETQAVSSVFANSITIREIAQRYINNNNSVSALGTNSNNERANWYTLNVMTTNLVKLLGYEAVLDAGMLEYQSAMRIKKVTQKNVNAGSN